MFDTSRSVGELSKVIRVCPDGAFDAILNVIFKNSKLLACCIALPAPNFKDTPISPVAVEGLTGFVARTGRAADNSDESPVDSKAAVAVTYSPIVNVADVE